MAELSKNYDRIMSEIEERIKNPQELEFIKSKFSELTVMFIDTIGKLVDNNEKQIVIEKKVNKMQKSLKKIEEDIYVDDDCECDDCNCDDYDEECNCDECDGHNCHGDQMHDNDVDYEFEIVCPYCNYEFVTGKETNLKDELECPKCHNIIELDWDDYCDGECNHCNNHCYSDDKIEEISVNEKENNDYKHIDDNKKENNDNEDDM